MPRLAKPKAKVAKAEVPKKVRKTRAKREKPEPHPYEKQVGALVRYYEEGWRHGYLEEVIYGLTEAKDVLIRPMSGYKGAKLRCIQIPLNDIGFV